MIEPTATAQAPPAASLPAGVDAGLDDAEREPVARAWAQWVEGAPAPAAARAEAVAAILGALGVDGECRAAALVRQCPGCDPERLTAALGEDVAHLVAGVARMDAIPGLREQVEAEGGPLEGLRKLLLAMAEDIRVVLIKLAEHLVTLRELTRSDDPDARRAAAEETLDIYAPLANRLGIWQIKWELEDLAFRFTEPERYQAIAGSLAERRQQREAYIEGVKAELREALKAEHVDARVSGRPKHIYSIWRKMRQKEVDFHGLYDVRALRVITRTVKDCYAALGVVHGLWQHVPREFDDYIAHPKGNNYRSLHTAVVGPGGKTLEVQIRTEEMHRQAELGIAAHWRYKEGGRQDPVFEEKIAWLRQVLEPREEGDAPGDFLDRFKTEVFHDRVYVLSPQGRVVDLPRGATPLDFAYAIHSEVGNRCRGAKVGGSIVPLTYTLQNGDQVEILTARNGTPSRDWLNPALGYLHTSRARGKVRAWFKAQDLDKNVAAGRDLLDRDLRRLGAGDVAHDKLAQRLGFTQVADLYAALGRGDVGSGQVAGAVREHVLPEREPEVPPQRPPPRQASTDDVVIAGVGNLMTHLARCCKPLPPDPITGYITQGHGVTIHRRDCPNALNLESREPSRIIDVEWGGDSANAYPVDVDILAYDRRGLLRDITLLLAGEKVNVSGVNSHTDPRTGIAHIAMTVEVADIDTLSRVLGQLGRLHNLIEVRRRT